MQSGQLNYCWLILLVAIPVSKALILEHFCCEAAHEKRTKDTDNFLVTV
jgi:hypothetical protein